MEFEEVEEGSTLFSDLTLASCDKKGGALKVKSVTVPYTRVLGRSVNTLEH